MAVPAGIAEQRMSFAPRGLPGSPGPWKLSPARGFWNSEHLRIFIITSGAASMVFMV